MRRRLITFVLILIMLIPVVLFSDQNIVNKYGQLKVIGNKICDSQGNPVQLKGVSSHGLQWYPFVEDQTVPNILSIMNIDVIRAAMYVKEWDAANNHYAGYLGVHSNVKETVKAVVRDAIDAGIYVIVDWHLHWNYYDPNNPHWTDDPFTSEAVSFFNEMANTTYNGKAFKDYPNVIWEVMNEPGHDISWDQVKNHANTVINEIRNGVNDPDNLILVPAQNWCQNLDVVAYDNSSNRPDRLYSNIVYTLHFYAASHGNEVRNKAQIALDNGLAIFADEWGVCDYTGNGAPNWDACVAWINWMDQNMVSWATWNYSDKNETSALLDPGAGLSGPWTENQLSLSGEWVDGWIGEADSNNDPPNNNGTPISAPFDHNGSGTFDFELSGTFAFINSWGNTVVTINNVNYTNLYISYDQMPPQIDGKWYIHIESNEAWSHFEVR